MTVCKVCVQVSHSLYWLDRLGRRNSSTPIQAPALPTNNVETQLQPPQILPVLVNCTAYADISFLHFVLPVSCSPWQKNSFFHIQKDQGVRNQFFPGHESRLDTVGIESRNKVFIKQPEGRQHGDHKRVRISAMTSFTKYKVTRVRFTSAHTKL